MPLTPEPFHYIGIEANRYLCLRLLCDRLRLVPERCRQRAGIFGSNGFHFFVGEVSNPLPISLSFGEPEGAVGPAQT